MTSADRLAASRALWERARRVMPGGVYGHQNGAAHGELHPRFLARGEGARIWDVAVTASRCPGHAWSSSRSGSSP